MATKLGVFTVEDSPESYLELYQDKKLKSHADFEKHIDNKIKAQIENKLKWYDKQILERNQEVFKL